MDTSERKQAHIAYGCYLLIATCLAIALLLDVISWGSTSAEKMAFSQVAGMVILLPMIVASVPAALLAIVLSFKLGDWCAKERGLCVLPWLLIASVVALAVDAQGPGRNHWLAFVQAAYVALTFFFSIRWFTVAGKRA
jgi:hypothetical protein